MSKRRTNWLKAIASLMMVGGVVAGVATQSPALGIVVIAGFLLFVVSRFLDADSKVE
jgi:hypothetical protein